MLRTTTLTALALALAATGCSQDVVTSASGIPNEQIEATIVVVSDGNKTEAFAELNLDDEQNAYRLLELDNDDRVELRIGDDAMPLKHERDWNLSQYLLEVDRAAMGVEATVAILRADEGNTSSTVQLPPDFELTYPSDTKVIELPMEEGTKVTWTVADRDSEVEVRVEGDCIYPVSEMTSDSGRFEGLMLQPRTTHETGECDVNVSVVRHAVGTVDTALAADSTIVAEQIRTVTIRAEFRDSLRGL